MSLTDADWLCSFPGCSELPTIDYKHCAACHGSLCPEHIYHPSIGHVCPTLEVRCWQWS
jgi:hypothetical protein